MEYAVIKTRNNAVVNIGIRGGVVCETMQLRRLGFCRFWCRTFVSGNIAGKTYIGIGSGCVGFNGIFSGQKLNWGSHDESSNC